MTWLVPSQLTSWVQYHPANQSKLIFHPTASLVACHLSLIGKPISRINLQRSEPSVVFCHSPWHSHALICRFDKLVIFLRNNRITKLSSSLCDSSNKGWNMGQVALFGCDAILCPPRTANFHGRQSSESEPCLTCASNANLYGQITCDGIPLEASSSSPLIQGAILTLVLSVLVEILLIH